MAAAASPMQRTPFWVTRRSDRFLKRFGTHSSADMAASVRGPSTKPVWAATESRAPSDTSVSHAIAGPISSVPIRHPRVSCSHSDALRVLPLSNWTSLRR